MRWRRNSGHGSRRMPAGIALADWVAPLSSSLCTLRPDAAPRRSQNDAFDPSRTLTIVSWWVSMCACESTKGIFRSRLRGDDPEGARGPLLADGRRHFDGASASPLDVWSSYVSPRCASPLYVFGIPDRLNG